MAEEDARSADNQTQKSPSVCDTICTLYVLMTVMLGIALPCTYFISGQLEGKGLYVAVFHVWLYITSLMVLFYVEIYLCGLRRQVNNTGSLTTEDSVDVDALRDLNNIQLDDAESTLAKDLYEGLDSRSVGGNSSTIDHNNVVSHIMISTQKDHPSYTHHGKGVNFFFRMGLIVFGMGSVILDGFRLLQFVETDKALLCHGHYFIVHTALRITFVFSQTFFIFKNHKLPTHSFGEYPFYMMHKNLNEALIVNFKKGFIKFGLLHIVATNVCIWSLTVVYESANSYERYSILTKQIQVSMSVKSSENYRQIPHTISSYAVENVDKSTLNDTSSTCHVEKTLADKAATYLYPCTIQFCIIAVALLLNIYSNVGLPTQARLPTTKSAKLIGGLCHKSNTGLFLGLVILVLTCISACFFLLYDESKYPYTIRVTVLLYLANDATVTCITFLAVLIGFCRLCKLDKCKSGETLIDRYLLFISLGGYSLLLIFIMVPTLKTANFEDRRGILSIVHTALYMLSLLQALLQVTFIIDGLKRSTSTRRQLKRKPGRSVVTFILICNLALWIINTFQFKEMHSSIILRFFYGDLSWQIIMHLCFPLAACFRFYSSVALADIWLKAYKRKRQNSQIYRVRHDSDKFI